MFKIPDLSFKALVVPRVEIVPLRLSPDHSDPGFDSCPLNLFAVKFFFTVSFHDFSSHFFRHSHMKNEHKRHFDTHN